MILYDTYIKLLYLNVGTHILHLLFCMFYLNINYSYCYHVESKAKYLFAYCLKTRKGVGLTDKI